jgi:hypothetical protein
LERVAATAFVLGGSLFAIGAALAQADVGGPLLPASVYLAGGVFFCTGGYVSVRLQDNRQGSLAWTSAVVLFVGTLVFGVNLIDSFISELTPREADRLIWSPDLIGCLFFLVSGHLAMVDLSGDWLPCWRPESREWRIIAVNQVGSAPPSPPSSTPTATLSRPGSPTGGP